MPEKNNRHSEYILQIPAFAGMTIIITPVIPVSRYENTGISKLANKQAQYLSARCDS